MDRDKISLNGLEERVRDLAADAKTAMYVAVDGRVAGVVAVADVIRDSAREAVRLLHDSLESRLLRLEITNTRRMRWRGNLERIPLLQRYCLRTKQRR